MVGQTVGKYRVVARLGRGGMGTVYKAVDETLDREVAIKRLHPDLSEPDLLKRFRAEAVALARLNHPNIATLFELAEHDGELLMIMEFVHGETLEALTQRVGPMPIDRAVHLCGQVLDALGHAHRAGIVHRDLKPANLMLTESGLVKVTDFGLARMAGTEHLTNDGFMVGTPAYMSPEQVLGSDIDGRADLYAIAVVFYRLLTARLPFNAESGIAMVQSQINERPTPVRQIRTELPVACEEILTRALAKTPRERYQTADQFKAALFGLSGCAGPISISLPIPVAAAGSDPTIVLQRPPRPVSRVLWRRPVAAAAAIGLTGLIGLATAAFLVSLWRARMPGELPVAAPPPAALVEPPLASSSVVPIPPPRLPASTVMKDAPEIEKARVTESTTPATVVSGVALRTMTPTIPIVTFKDVKLFMMADGKAGGRSASLRLGTDGIALLDGDTPLEEAAYRDVIGLFLSHSREPRWATPDGTPMRIQKVGGKFAFIKPTPDWITVQTASAFIPLQVDDSELQRVIAELEARTGTKLVRLR
jgi:hypothetical protein